MGGKKACISKVESAEVPIACNLMVGSSEVCNYIKLTVPSPLALILLDDGKNKNKNSSHLLISGFIHICC